MEPILRVDASAYSEGQEFFIVADGTFGMYKIKFKSKGRIPGELEGSYSSARLAEKHVKAYLVDYEKTKEIKARRKAVKVGKEKWAARKTKQESEVTSA